MIISMTTGVIMVRMSKITVREPPHRTEEGLEAKHSVIQLFSNCTRTWPASHDLQNPGSLPCSTES